MASFVLESTNINPTVDSSPPEEVIPVYQYDLPSSPYTKDAPSVGTNTPSSENTEFINPFTYNPQSFIWFITRDSGWILSTHFGVFSISYTFKSPVCASSIATPTASEPEKPTLWSYKVTTQYGLPLSSISSVNSVIP